MQTICRFSTNELLIAHGKTNSKLSIRADKIVPGRYTWNTLWSKAIKSGNNNLAYAVRLRIIKYIYGDYL